MLWSQPLPTPSQRSSTVGAAAESAGRGESAGTALPPDTAGEAGQGGQRPPHYSHNHASQRTEAAGVGAGGAAWQRSDVPHTTQAGVAGYEQAAAGVGGAAGASSVPGQGEAGGSMGNSGDNGASLHSSGYTAVTQRLHDAAGGSPSLVVVANPVAYGAEGLGVLGAPGATASEGGAGG